MRPHRVRLTTNLVDGYGLTDKMRLLRPAPRTREEIMLFHADGTQLFMMLWSEPYHQIYYNYYLIRFLTFIQFFADYVDFLISVTPENQEEFMMQMRRFNLGPVGEADCPVFDGMFEYFQVSIPWVCCFISKTNTAACFLIF